MGLMKNLNVVKTMGSTPRMRLGGGAIEIQGKVVYFFDAPAMARRMAKAEYAYLRNWGRYVQRVARNSIKGYGLARPAPKKKYLTDGTTYAPKFREWLKEAENRPASSPGTPPHTHTGLLRKAILFGFDPLRECAVVGPSIRIISVIGAVHERGWRRYGRQYPKRPFMVPAEEETRKGGLERFWPKT